MTGQISLVATPIGNLGDITERALRTLRDADVILAEDTRNTAKLLHHFEITTSVRSYHQHSSKKELGDILSLLADGQHLALVTDAGTPGVSDPGNLLLDAVYEHYPDTRVEPIPGASALTAALSVCGFATDKFVFLGFPPHKNKRKKYFEQVAAQELTTVFYESCHRIEKAMSQLSEVLDPNRRICICRELTKQFESTYRGTIAEVAAMEIPTKGEFVIIIEKF